MSGSERAARIAQAMKNKSAMEAYQLTLCPEKKTDIFSTKFGGLPYWDPAREYPVNPEGEKLVLLAQVNFTEARLGDPRLPGEGMLQFFISGDDLYGMDYDRRDVQSGFRVVYHRAVDPGVTEGQVRALELPTNSGCDFPVVRESAVEITKTTAYITPEDAGFEELFRETVMELFGEDTKGRRAWQYLGDGDWDCLHRELCASGHWMLGYPFFTQDDPRRRGLKRYDTLLLQMDSDMVGRQDYTLWGDCGVANFFISGEDLARRDFSRVLYNWDCC